MADPIAGAVVQRAFGAMLGGGDPAVTDQAIGVSVIDLIASTPVGRLVTFSGGQVTREQLEQLLAAANSADPG